LLSTYRIGVVVTYLRTEEEDILTLLLPYHVSFLVIGLLLALHVTGDLSHSARESRGPEVLGQRSYQRRRQAEIDPSGERSNRLLVLLVALMVYPLALKVTTLESQGSPVYSWATVL
jgi:hypothetical protein|tara:strand:- start:33 stop:383 length:351 start_codon:yes stop_codon:yes gene_type:complete